MPGLIDLTSKKKKRLQEEARLANNAALLASEDKLRATSHAWREEKDVSQAERRLLHLQFIQIQQQVTKLKSIASAAAEASSNDSDDSNV